MNLKMKLVREGAKIPTRATEGAAAADLCVVCAEQGVDIAPGERVLMPTGVAIELPGPDYVALVFARSGLGVKKGVSLVNGVGVIDSDYRGEICVGLVNLSDEVYTVQNGERVAQLTVMPVVPFTVQIVDELGETTRAQGGFGSTGKQ